MTKLTLFTDGGSRGNPGPAAYGYVVYDMSGVPVEPVSSSGLPAEPLSKSDMPAEPLSKSGLPAEPLNKSGLPDEPLNKSGLPAGPVSKSGLPDEALAKSGAGIILEKCGNYLGETTNNQAEYSGLLEGIRWILNNQPDAQVAIKMDSLLVVNQVKGLYKMKNAALQPKFLEVRALLSKLSAYTIDYVPRAQNSVADSLVNQALDAYLK